MPLNLKQVLHFILFIQAFYRNKVETQYAKYCRLNGDIFTGYKHRLSAVITCKKAFKRKMNSMKGRQKKEKGGRGLRRRITGKGSFHFFFNTPFNEVIFSTIFLLRSTRSGTCLFLQNICPHDVYLNTFNVFLSLISNNKQ